MTGKQRIKRIERLASLRERERDSARGELANAQRATERAERAHEEAENRWVEEVADSESDAPVSIHDFAVQRMHLHTLRREADRAQLRKEQAQAHEQQKLEAATAAQRELRKMELWSESEIERQRTEHERLDQKITDELAARIVQRRDG
jgi:flagellar export protein FliJ